jgi:lipopolysaccharide biosynthesis protein
MRRLAIYLFYDDAGIVDDYVVHMLKALREHCATVLVVCNGEPGAAGMERLRASADRVLVRENVGFDVGGYKAALEGLDRAELEQQDEILLMNYTFFGPIFPLGEMFDRMDSTEVDFWGITAHRETESPFEAGDQLDFHIQSHFIAVRRSLFQSESFWSYWRDMPVIRSYVESIKLHEARFTAYFSELGFSFALYMDPLSFDTDHPVFLEIERTVEQRCPILKRRPLFHDPLYLEKEAIDLRRAMDLIRENSDYDPSLIWKNMLRTTPLRTLYTNLDQLDIFPLDGAVTLPVEGNEPRIAVVAHVYYEELVGELLSYALNIPGKFDLIVTTPSEEKRARILDSLVGFDRGELVVKVLESNQGRDTSALLIGCRAEMLDGGYDLVCRLHTKKSPQDGVGRGLMFKKHLLENLLGSRAYVGHVLAMFQNEPYLGVAIPPVVHIGYPTLGHGWFLNKARAKDVAAALGLAVPFDVCTPLAAYGSMFWFKPAALRKIFEHQWTWADFDEASYGDGDLPHVIERLLTYVAQDAGYMTRCVMTDRQAAKNYVKLEYKLQALASCFPSGDVRVQIGSLMQRHETDMRVPGLGESMRSAGLALKRSVSYRFPWFVTKLRPLYRTLRG